MTAEAVDPAADVVETNSVNGKAELFEDDELIVLHVREVVEFVEACNNIILLLFSNVVLGSTFKAMLPL